eukprot:COSAG06_NODE_22007_length_737_cov_2.159875_1_plen_217_part_00
MAAVSQSFRAQKAGTKKGQPFNCGQIKVTRVRALCLNCPTLVPASYGTDGKLSLAQMSSMVPVVVGQNEIQTFQAQYDNSVPCDIHGVSVDEEQPCIVKVFKSSEITPLWRLVREARPACRPLPHRDRLHAEPAEFAQLYVQACCSAPPHDSVCRLLGWGSPDSADGILSRLMLLCLYGIDVWSERTDMSGCGSGSLSGTSVSSSTGGDTASSRVR